MFKYVLRRLMYIVVVFLIGSVLIFSLYKSVPGDPARLMIEGNKANMKPAEYEALYQGRREEARVGQTPCRSIFHVAFQHPAVISAIH